MGDACVTNITKSSADGETLAEESHVSYPTYNSHNLKMVENLSGNDEHLWV